MAQSEMIIDLKLNTASVQAESKMVQAAFSGLCKSAEKVGTALKDAFSVKGYTGYLAAVDRFGKQLANALLCLQLNFGKLKAAIVNAAAPIASVFVPMLNQALLGAIRFVNGMGAVLRTLFWGSEANMAFAQSTENAENAQKSLSRSVTSTGKAVKKSLAGFDELDKLAAPTGGSASGQSDAIQVPDTVTDTLSPQLQTVVNRILKILEPLKNIDFSPLVEAVNRLRTAMQPITQALFTGLKWAYDNLFVPLATWTVEDILPGFLNALSAAAKVLQEALAALQPLGSWLWTTFLQPIAQWTGGVILQVLQWLTEKLTGISQWISQNQTLVEGIALVIASVAAAIGLVNGALGIWNVVIKAGVAVTAAFGGAMALLTNPVTLVAAAIGAVIAVVALLIRNWDDVKTVAANVWNTVKSIWGSAGDWFRQNLAEPFSSVWESVKTVCSGGFTWLRQHFFAPFVNVIENVLERWHIALSWLGQTLLSIFTDIWGRIQGIWSNVPDWFRQNLLVPLSNVWTQIQGVWNNMGGWFQQNLLVPLSNIWTQVQNIWNNAPDWFRQNVVNPLAGIWSSVQSSWSSIAGWFRNNLLSPLVNGFRKMVNGIIGFINGMIRGIVSGINTIVNAVNSISFTLPTWLPGIGGQSLGFSLKPVSLPQIPYLAQGAVLPANKPFLAMVGDQKYGTNIEAPLVTIQEALANVLKSYSGQEQTRVTVNFTGDLAQLGRVLKPVIDVENQRRGMSLVKGGQF